ncbi:MAG: adenylate/guanylate cyclase domain-containing protein [Gemmataceae bacterium]
MSPRSTWTDLVQTARFLREAGLRLRESVQPGAPDRFVTAVDQMAQRAAQFAEQTDRPEPVDLQDRTTRHDLRAHLALIIGYVDLWTRRGAQSDLARYQEPLLVLAAVARQALGTLDGLAAVPAIPPGPGLPSGTLPSTLPAERGRLLVVDDNRENRDLLRALLEQQGHTVAAVASGAEALALLGHEAFDLILLDVMMPEMDGFTVLERLKTDDRLRHIPVVMVSALDRLDTVVACIARGAEDYLTRPFNELLLRARVGACLEKKRLRDREVGHLNQIDSLLHAIFPPEVVQELTNTGVIQPRRHERVGVCFVDIVGFTAFCDRHAGNPEEVVGLLEWYVEAFEEIARRHRVQKIKTIGDAFLMVSGLPLPTENPVLQLVCCAIDLLQRVREGPAGWQVRVGVHVGPVVAGTLGQSQYSFDLWGSTVNIAARLESIGRPGTITLSDEAWNDIRHLAQGRCFDVALRGVGPRTIWEFVSFLANNPSN